MAHGSRKLATVVLSASCLTAGLMVAPALGVPGPGSASDEAVLTAPRESVSATRVRPGRIKIRVTMNGDLLGSKPRITLIGVGGPAKGVTRRVRVRSFAVVKGLQPGRYRISARKSTAAGRTVTPLVTPARVRLTRNHGAAVLVRYRIPGVPDWSQGDEYAPVQVTSGATFTTVSAGDSHTCGIDRAGKAWCWGADSKGGLGDGKDDQGNEYSPVAVAGRHTFVTLSAGGMYTCAIDTAGKAWCWGSDGNGKLGDGDDDQSREYSPVPVAGGHAFTTLTASNMHTCGVDTAGKAWCWGWDTSGAAGDGDDGQGNNYIPAPVASDATFITVTAGNEHTCGIDTAGKAWCWGADYAGALGDGQDGQGDEYSPAAVAGGHTFTTLTAGLRHTCGVDTAGAAWCWGADWEGQLGDGGDQAPGQEFAPVAVTGRHTWTAVTAGDNHTCGVDTAGTAWCWGAAGSGRLGDGYGYELPMGEYRRLESAPVTVTGGHTWTALTAGYEHTCGVDTAGKAWCWGADGLGQVGDGDEYKPWKN